MLANWLSLQNFVVWVRTKLFYSGHQLFHRADFEKNVVKGPFSYIFGVWPKIIKLKFFVCWIGRCRIVVGSNINFFLYGDTNVRWTDFEQTEVIHFVKRVKRRKQSKFGRNPFAAHLCRHTKKCLYSIPQQFYIVRSNKRTTLILWFLDRTM